MTSDELRKLAAELRLEEARRGADKRDKCAEIVVAARGLGLLARKLLGGAPCRLT